MVITSADITNNFVYSVGFHRFCYYHKEDTKKAYRTHQESIKKGASILALPLLLDV